MTLPNYESVEASVEYAMNRLGQQTALLGNLVDTAPIMVFHRKQGPFSQKMKELYVIADKISEIVGLVSACKKGCSSCCHMAVTIDSYEARQIGEAYGITPETLHTGNRALSQDQEVLKYLKVPCVFLKAGECQIYAHRPMACRMYHNLSAYPELCDLENEGATVPNLDTRRLTSVAAALAFNHGESFGDIREFFPHGLTKP